MSGIETFRWFLLCIAFTVAGYSVGEKENSRKNVEQFDKTLKESLKECTDKYQLTMVLQERVEACEQGLTVMEEELDSCLDGSLYGTER